VVTKDRPFTSRVNSNKYVDTNLKKTQHVEYKRLEHIFAAGTCTPTIINVLRSEFAVLTFNNSNNNNNNNNDNKRPLFIITCEIFFKEIGYNSCAI